MPTVRKLIILFSSRIEYTIKHLAWYIYHVLQRRKILLELYLYTFVLELYLYTFVCQICVHVYIYVLVVLYSYIMCQRPEAYITTKSLYSLYL